MGRWGDGEMGGYCSPLFPLFPSSPSPVPPVPPRPPLPCNRGMRKFLGYDRQNAWWDSNIDKIDPESNALPDGSVIVHLLGDTYSGTPNPIPRLIAWDGFANTIRCRASIARSERTNLLSKSSAGNSHPSRKADNFSNSSGYTGWLILQGW